jgi:glycosyltransferase involved in cell wall biosynthesis
MRAKRPRVTHVITALNSAGGAERLLVRLLEELGDEERRAHSVVTLRGGTMAPQVAEMGVPISTLGMSGLPTPADVLRLGQTLREAQADVVQTWLLHSNVLTGLTVRAVSQAPVVWGVHLTDARRSALGTKAVLVQRAEGICSWFVPSRIVACSVSSREQMHKMHYRRKRIVTIVNGFDVEHFKPNPAARNEVRRELGLSPTTPVIGHVGRFHPIKGHAILLAAAARVREQVPDVRFVLCGPDVTPNNPELSALAAPLEDRVLMLGRRNDVSRLLNAFDLAVSSSFGEALPLAVGEAMATGVPVVATRCGDLEELIADTGVVTPVNDSNALAQAMVEVITKDSEQRMELGRRARARIGTLYSLERMVEEYRELWDEVAHENGRA